MGDMWNRLGSPMLGLLETYGHKLVSFFDPYNHLIFEEYSTDGDDCIGQSKDFRAIDMYLGSSSCNRAKRLKASIMKGDKPPVFRMAEQEQVTDKFKGVKVWWALETTNLTPHRDTKRFYKLTFHRQNWEIITRSYLNHVLDEGQDINLRSWQRKLYTNKTSNGRRGPQEMRMWGHVFFEHPAKFDTLAMEPTKKQEIIDDLNSFRNAKDYYTKIGKAWKRGYLLYGPPGTGKSTMVVAMANFLEYDIYDLELTSVKDNTELRKLLIDTTSKSIIVIEDIDCSLDLTGQRKRKMEKDEETMEENDPVKKKMKYEETTANKCSNVTLSGLLNFNDGIWSACGNERIIIFTTNHVEQLDPALLRSGRMDKHIKMSYCCFEAFKVLAKNYWDLDWHPLFESISCLLKETNMTPADVAENLMRKSPKENAETCLKNLIKALEKAKEETRLKAEEKERLNAEKEKEQSAEAVKDKEPEVKNVTAVKTEKENGGITDG